MARRRRAATPFLFYKKKKKDVVKVNEHVDYDKKKPEEAGYASVFS